MIGIFNYDHKPQPKHVAVELAWQGSYAIARVVAPDWVVDALVDTNTGIQVADEFVGLSFALSYAVLVSTLSGASLTISGDRSAWPDEWGKLHDSANARQLV